MLPGTAQCKCAIASSVDTEALSNWSLRQVEEILCGRQAHRTRSANALARILMISSDLIRKDVSLLVKPWPSLSVSRFPVVGRNRNRSTARPVQCWRTWPATQCGKEENRVEFLFENQNQLHFMTLHSLITFDFPQSLITPRHLECQGPRLMTTSARSSWIVRPCAGLWNFYGAMAASWPGLENAGNCYGKFDSGSLEDSGYCIGRIERIELIHMDLRLQTETALEGRWSTVLGTGLALVFFPWHSLQRVEGEDVLGFP